MNHWQLVLEAWLSNLSAVVLMDVPRAALVIAYAAAGELSCKQMLTAE